MSDGGRVEKVRFIFAQGEGEPEDAAVVAAKGQTTVDFGAARQSCGRVIAFLQTCLGRLRDHRSLLE